MTRPCCAQPIVRVIKIADSEVGLIGLDKVLQYVCTSGTESAHDIMSDLLQWVKDFGNHVLPSQENGYKKAPVREYRVWVRNVEHDTKTDRTRSSTL